MRDSSDSIQRMYRAAWCLFMFDAIDGPMVVRPSKDKERDEEYWSRHFSRNDVLTLHPDFVDVCSIAFPHIDAGRIRDAFRDGLITRDAVEKIWRSNVRE